LAEISPIFVNVSLAYLHAQCSGRSGEVHGKKNQTDGYRLSMLTIDGALEDDDDPDEDRSAIGDSE
jgi:hypothetical protein